jgi:hypothetical protein
MPVVDASLPLADVYEALAQAMDGTTAAYTRIHVPVGRTPERPDQAACPRVTTNRCSV